MTIRKFHIVVLILFAVLLYGGISGKTIFAEEAAFQAVIELTAEEKAFLAGKQLRLGIDVVRPPFEFVDDKGRYAGISAGFIEEAAKRLGIPVLPQKEVLWKDALERTKTGGIDVIPKITPTAEREKYLIFTKPYATFPSVIITRTDGRFVGGLNDLAGLKVAVVKGLVVQELLKRDRPDVPLILLPSVESGLRELSIGKVDVFIDNLGTVSHTIDKLGLTNLKIAAPTPYNHDLAFGVRKDWPLMASALDKALASISDQERAVIKGRWLAVQYHKGVSWQIIGAVALAALAVVASVLLWNRRLRRTMHMQEETDNKLKRYTEELELSSRIREAVAGVTSAIQKVTTFSEFAHALMSQAAPLLGIEYGVVYIHDKERKLLVPAGGYGCSAADGIWQEFELGQGLVGQAACEQRSITVTDTGGSGIMIAWGSGTIAPGQILVQPVLQRDKTEAVLVLASLTRFNDYSRSLLDELLPVLAMHIEVLDRTVRTQMLLDASREQSEKLQVQTLKLEQQQAELQDAADKRDQANKALLSQVEELAMARRAMMNIMEDMEASRKESEERSVQTSRLLEETRIQTDQLQAQQQQIKETELWYSGIIESAPDGMLVTNDTGEIILTNTMLDTMFGYQRGELLGWKVEELLPHAVRSGHVELRSAFLRSGIPREMGKGLVLTGLRKGDSEFPVEVSLSMLPALGERRACVCATIRDIAERKELEASLLQQMEELERFNRLTVNREERMIELKEEINSLLEQMNRDKKYTIVT